MQTISNSFDRYTVQNGLSQNTVRVIAQDSISFLWVGTSDGLNRYDGQEIKIYKPNVDDAEYSLSSGIIQAITQDSQGRLWVGTRKGVRIYDARYDHFIRYEGDTLIDNLSMGRIYEDNEGVLWMLPYYESKILKLDSRKSPKIEVIETADIFKMPIPEDIYSLITTLHFDKVDTDVIWITTYGLGVLKYSKNQQKVIERIEVKELPDDSNEVLAMAEDDEENLWLASNSGVMKLSKRSGEKTFYRPTNSKLPSPYVHTIYFSQEKEIWAGTVSGLAHFKNGDFEIHKHDPADLGSISSNLLREIFQDEAGIIWIGTYIGGLNKYDLQKIKFHHYYKKPDSNNSSHKSIRGFAEDKYGDLWIATDGGLNRLNLKTNHSTYYYKATEPTSISGERINAIDMGKNGELWIGTSSHGINRLVLDDKPPHEPTFTWYQVEQGLTDENIYSLKMDDTGILWVGTRDDGLVKYNPDSLTFKSYPHDQQIHVSIRDICIREDGKLWLGTEGGLSLFDSKTETFRHFTHDSEDKKSLSNRNVQAVHIDKKGRTWVAT